jgi:5-methylcytosine-specific restriction endonuclease McrA
MPTNPTGYNQQYYKRERKNIIEKLGGKCAECGVDSKLEIHHIKPCGMGANRGTFRRLTEWKKNMDNLKVLCHDCHVDWHKVNGVEYNGR